MSTATKNSLGIIFPPPEIKAIIDKTAMYVAKNGPEFETRVSREREESGKLRFEFLLSENPYRPYFDMKVKEWKTGEVIQEPEIPQAIRRKRLEEENKKKKKEELRMLTQYGEADAEIKPPPPDNHILSHPYIAPVDMDVIKLTAQFVARNGQKFLMGLTQRERNNPQFDFLKPTHALFGYFTSLVDSYILCLVPEAKEIDKMKEYSGSFGNVLNICHNRYLYEAQKETERKCKEKQEADEKAHLIAIDWHDFSLVQSVEFNDDEEYPPPMDFSQGLSVIRPLGQQQQLEPPKPTTDSTATESEKKKIAEEAGPELPPGFSPKPPDASSSFNPSLSDRSGGFSSRPPSQAGITTIIDEEGEIIIKKDWQRKPRRAVAQDTMEKCPITGRLVPSSKFSEHLRVLLQDPQWKEQRDKLLERAKSESALAAEGDVEYNLASFVSRRPDLFGSVEDEVLVHRAELHDEEDMRPRKGQKIV